MDNKQLEATDNVEFIKKALLGFIIIFCLTYRVVLAQVVKDNNDYIPHLYWATMVEWDNLIAYLKNIISYPLWHFAVNIGINNMRLDNIKATALVTALYNGFAYLSILIIWGQLKNLCIKKEKMVFWALSLLIVNPIYVPWVNPLYALGQASPNIWHNPTHIAVKGFGVICFGLLLILLKRKEYGRKNLSLFLLFTVMLVLSALAKPSFLQGFVPGVGIFIILRLIIERKKFNLKFYLCLCACFIPEVAVLGFQVISTFFNSDYVRDQTFIRIGWGDVLHQWTPSLYFSFLAAFLFPLFVLFMNFNKLIKKEEIQVLICFEAAAWLESVVLYEEGAAFSYGNFIWASLMSAFIVWIFMTYYFLQDLYDPENRDEKKKKIYTYIGIPLYMTHLLFGLFYWYSLITTSAPY